MRARAKLDEAYDGNDEQGEQGEQSHFGGAAREEVEQKQEIRKLEVTMAKEVDKQRASEKAQAEQAEEALVAAMASGDSQKVEEAVEPNYETVSRS